MAAIVRFSQSGFQVEARIENPAGDVSAFAALQFRQLAHLRPSCERLARALAEVLSGFYDCAVEVEVSHPGGSSAHARRDPTCGGHTKPLS